MYRVTWQIECARETGHTRRILAPVKRASRIISLVTWISRSHKGASSSQSVGHAVKWRLRAWNSNDGNYRKFLLITCDRGTARYRRKGRRKRFNLISRFCRSIPFGLTIRSLPAATTRRPIVNAIPNSTTILLARIRRDWIEFSLGWLSSARAELVSTDFKGSFTRFVDLACFESTVHPVKSSPCRQSLLKLSPCFVLRGERRFIDTAARRIVPISLTNLWSSTVLSLFWSS